MGSVSIIMPAYGAASHIGYAVRSVLAQRHADWLLWVISDDGVDYEALLGAVGLADARFRFLSSGRVGGGASHARNLALDRLDTPYVAILDADDRFAPDKLVQVVAALADHPVVSSALAVVDEAFSPLRHVGVGPDQVLGPARHKLVNFSMDSMIAWDRRRCDARYDLELTNMTDLEVLMQLFRTAERSFHIGTPLHDYVKRVVSMSNGPGVTEQMIRAKQILLERLRRGAYPMADAAGPAAIAAFLEVSLAAEASYPRALTRQPGLLFEDHLEPQLAAVGG
jgi:glycosyltransferase involved in cell wall biosynthesis